MNNNTNLILTIILSIGILFGWRFWVEEPRLAKVKSEHVEYKKTVTKAKTTSQKQAIILDTKDALALSTRVAISTPKLKGSIALKGLKFDDLVLMDYDLEVNSQDKVTLLSPSNTKNVYFASFGWINDNSNTMLPNKDSLWKCDGTILDVDNKITFSWTNPDNVKFLVIISVDHNYMFEIEQKVLNHSNKTIALQNYGLINRTIELSKLANSYVLHEGMIGNINSTLEEIDYKTLQKKKNMHFAKQKLEWAGITDKYWLTSFIPDRRYEYNTTFSYGIQNGQDRFQVSFLGKNHELKPGASIETNTLFFTGAKKVALLDRYKTEYDIKLFDRAIDFGIFYIITKPLFYLMNFIYNYCGNFGISILIATLIIKILAFTLARKSYVSMQKIKLLSPDVENLKTLYKDNMTKAHTEISALYKKHKVNPFSSILPILLQIPILFSIYKVIYVTIEMRHAPFFSFTQDLASQDRSNLFTLFDLLPWDHPTFLVLGAWPILNSLTMYLQQKLTPTTASVNQDQMNMMKMFPLIMLFVSSQFPVGLLLYWAWSNILSIIQQLILDKLYPNK
jgi:YidC/Oxa1 family membrane protein insertase